MTRRKRNPRRMLPVRSAMMPTMRGPRNEADLSVSAKREKKEDSWPCVPFSARKVFLPLDTRLTGGMSSANTALE
jgi:hypothetical protein